ncbi:hypothetical protein ABFA07_016140 [Porites harrisoni]
MAGNSTNAAKMARFLAIIQIVTGVLLLGFGIADRLVEGTRYYIMTGQATYTSAFGSEYGCASQGVWEYPEVPEKEPVPAMLSLVCSWGFRLPQLYWVELSSYVTVLRFLSSEDTIPTTITIITVIMSDIITTIVEKWPFLPSCLS